MQATTQNTERVWCEAHQGQHNLTAECVWAHLVGPTGTPPQVGHPLRVTD